MNSDDDFVAADPEQLEQLEELVARARSLGMRTGIRNDEIPDLTQEAAAEIIEQLRARLGELNR